MKKLFLISAIAISGMMVQTANAQIHLGLHVNLGGPVYVPAAPVYADDDYYYLPDVQAYYSVNSRMYYYNDGYNWVSAAYLPGAYRDYDWTHARRFEVRGDRPYLHDDVYRARYGAAEHFDWNRREGYDRDRAYAAQPRNDHQDYNREQYRGDNREQYHGDDRGQYQQRNYQQQSYSRPQAQPQYNRGNDDRGRERDGGHDRHGI